MDKKEIERKKKEIKAKRSEDLRTASLMNRIDGIETNEQAVTNVTSGINAALYRHVTRV